MDRGAQLTSHSLCMAHLNGTASLYLLLGQLFPSTCSEAPTQQAVGCTTCFSRNLMVDEGLSLLHHPILM